MSRGWVRSNLTVGEEVRVPMTICIEPYKAVDRFISSKYIGETSTGLLIDCEFQPLFGQTKTIHYTRFIDWSSIWCGHVKVYKTDDTQIKARRKPGLPLAIGQQSTE